MLDGLKGRLEQAVKDLDCFAQVMCTLCKMQWKVIKVLWIVNYMFHKDYFGSNVKGRLGYCFLNFPDKNYLK